MSGAEKWPMKKKHEDIINVAEMRMLKWICGGTRRDKIQNTKIRRTVKMTEVTKVSKKVQERRNSWTFRRK